MRELLPKGWSAPKGFSHGVDVEGRMVVLAGQVGVDSAGRLMSPGFVEQAGQALRNIVALLEEGGARPEHLVRLTWYVTDMAEYLASQKPLGSIYRSIMGSHFPPMTLVAVSGLVIPGSKVEIEATAVVPTK